MTGLLWQGGVKLGRTEVSGLRNIVTQQRRMRPYSHPMHVCKNRPIQRVSREALEGGVTCFTCTWMCLLKTQNKFELKKTDSLNKARAQLMPQERKVTPKLLRAKFFLSIRAHRSGIFMQPSKCWQIAVFDVGCYQSGISSTKIHIEATAAKLSTSKSVRTTNMTDYRQILRYVFVVVAVLLVIGEYV